MEESGLDKFIKILSKQNALPLQDLCEHLKTQSKEQIPSCYTPEFQLMKRYVAVPEQSLKIIMKYVLSLPESKLESEILTIVSQLVQEQMKAFNLKAQKITSTVAEQLLVQIVSDVQPHIFYKIAPKVFENFKNHLSNPGCCNALLWVMCQQTVKVKKMTGPSPLGLEYWFKYFFPLLISSDVYPTMLEFIIRTAEEHVQMLDKMLARKIVQTQLPKVPIASFCAFLNHIIFKKRKEKEQKRLERVYRMSKNLLFSSEITRMIADTPAQVFCTLIGPLASGISDDVKRETLSIMTLAIATDSKDSGFLDAWTQRYQDFVQESIVLIKHLLDSRSTIQCIQYGGSKISYKLRTCGLYQTLLNIQKQNKQMIQEARKQRTETFALERVGTLSKKLLKLVRPPLPLGWKVFRWTVFLAWLLSTSFIFYALVFVMCHPATKYVCSLPFEPYQKYQLVAGYYRDTLTNIKEQLASERWETIKQATKHDFAVLQNQTLDQLQMWTNALKETPYYDQVRPTVEQASTLILHGWTQVVEVSSDIYGKIPFKDLETGLHLVQNHLEKQVVVLKQQWHLSAEYFVAHHVPYLDKQLESSVAWVTQVGVPQARHYSVLGAKEIRKWTRKGAVLFSRSVTYISEQVEHSPVFVKIKENEYYQQAVKSEYALIFFDTSRIVFLAIAQLGQRIIDLVDGFWHLLETPLTQEQIQAFANQILESLNDLWQRLQIRETIEQLQELIKPYLQ
ncbi:hypothetical protein EDD86DRAFT_198176 [Gorgonomyces haynaldii]|nr:hypothetical protein EDD86DRAFT_198176 [Gorgonomyces haynaldii]